ncbi:hypothetical protein EX30DRAFT_377742 [Ascodesmis nigricans]|uniref:Uncharacterized protein n=1 Tax=Ascodesmis nigricans TaxID=341454 RepID=A0A4S2MWU1_9PEZI|nr:hypothetical protein EX30DRAFT_377742 [Ascodesmis nigricans]
MSRGLDFGKVIECHCEYMEKEEVNKGKYAYNLGRLVMEETLLSLLKDGYYFTPTPSLGSDVAQIYAHVDGCEIIILEQSLSTWYKLGQPTLAPHHKQLYYAVKLCTGFHTAQRKAHVTYTVQGMKIMNKCSLLLNAILINNSDAHDLIWAMISTPKFFKDVAQALQVVSLQEVFELSDVWCTTESKQMDISQLLSKAPEREMRGLVDAEKYDFPLFSTGERRVFSTKQFLAAYIDLVLTYFWIEQA